MELFHIVIFFQCVQLILGYKNNLFTLNNLYYKFNDANCDTYDNPPSIVYYNQIAKQLSHRGQPTIPPTIEPNVTFRTMRVPVFEEKDVLGTFQRNLNRFLFGNKFDDDKEPKHKSMESNVTDELAHFPSGSVMRTELFLNKTAVHLPMAEFVDRGHCYLDINKDYMQTAVNAFSIFLWGNMDDLMRLPSLYVLHSARTIAMMNIAREKLSATWLVVKAGRPTISISHEILEIYRPLFKYINGKEMARLNLSDERILYYVGTHADLNRHQVGIIARRYIQINPNWRLPRYLNIMNNLICGVPMIFMRQSPETTYLQLSHQLFYHIHACDPLQRRFYLSRMTKTQVLGKSYSWSAHDVSRLGLLLSEVEGPELSLINPEAMAGISAQVMLEMPVSSLKYITDTQLRYIGQKAFNILARKMKIYQDKQQMFNKAKRVTMHSLLMLFIKMAT